IDQNCNYLTFLHQLRHIKYAFSKSYLGVVLNIHKMIIFPVIVKELKFVRLHSYILDLMPRRKCVLENFPRGYALHFGSYESRTFTRFNVKEFNYFINIMVIAYA